MTTTLISIGNSRCIRIPKPLLAESGLGEEVELRVKKEKKKSSRFLEKGSREDALILSEKALGTDWNRPEEDKAWENL